MKNAERCDLSQPLHASRQDGQHHPFAELVDHRAKELGFEPRVVMAVETIDGLSEEARLGVADLAEPQATECPNCGESRLERG